MPPKGHPILKRHDFPDWLMKDYPKPQPKSAAVSGWPSDYRKKKAKGGKK